MNVISLNVIFYACNFAHNACQIHICCSALTLKYENRSLPEGHHTQYLKLGLVRLRGCLIIAHESKSNKMKACPEGGAQERVFVCFGEFYGGGSCKLMIISTYYETKTGKNS